MMLLETVDFIKKEPIAAIALTAISGSVFFFFSQIFKAVGLYLRNQIVTIITVPEQHWFYHHVDTMITSLIAKTRYRCFELGSQAMKETSEYRFTADEHGVERDILGNRKDLGVSLVIGEGRCLVVYKGVIYYIYKYKTPKSNQQPQATTEYFIVGFTLSRKKALRIMTDCFDNASDNKETRAFYNRNSVWFSVSGSKSRSLDSVVCSPGVKETIISKLTKFYSSKNEYVRLGRPYKFVICLEGPPGTGKTSIIKAVATYFQKHIYCMGLDDVSSAAELYSLLSVRDGIFTFEDIGKTNIDVKSSADSKYTPVTLSTLFQAFDGILSPEGSVIFCTTNEYESLDPVLKRDLRFDIVLKIGLLEPQQQLELAALYGISDFVPSDEPIAGSSLAKRFDNILDK